MKKRLLQPVFIVMLFILVFIGLFYTDSSITGHISVPFLEENIDFYAVENQEIFLGLEDAGTFDLASIRITGKIIGEGDVDVFIEDEFGERFLVFTNQAKKSMGLIDITGFAVGSFCASSEDCEGGEVCDSGLCIVEVECYIDENCDNREVCENGLCTLLEGCLNDLDCSGLELCLEEVCVEVECLEDSDCGGGEKCLENECVFVECVGDSDCNEGYFCNEGDCVLKDIMLELIKPVGDLVKSSFFAIARYEINEGNDYKLKLFIDGEEYASLDVTRRLGIADFVVDSTKLLNGEHSLYFGIGDVFTEEFKFVVDNQEVVLEEDKAPVVDKTKKLIVVPVTEDKPRIKKSDIKGEKIYAFENECEDTCFISRGLAGNSYKLVVEVEKGTLLKIDEISYY